MKREEWEKLTVAKRYEWFKANLAKIFPSKKNPGKMKLVTQNKGAELPETVVLDSTGNIEIITHRPFGVFREFLDSFDQAVHLFGNGYMQAMISYPGSVVYQDSIRSDAFVGLRLFLGELDQFDKLVEGYNLYEPKKTSDRPYIPAKSFTHPYLGPMSSYRAEFFRALVQENCFDRFSTEVLDRVAGENASYKYTSQSVYRPDILRSQNESW